MSFKHFICALVLILALPLLSQTQYGINPPDSIKQACEKAIVSEIGRTAYSSSVKLIKCDMHKEGKLNNYTCFYMFAFPNVNESHVIFSMNCQADGKEIKLVKDTALKNLTRLPSSLKTRPPKVIAYSSAKKLACEHNTVMKANADKIYGELSTEYNAKLKDYHFVWHFYYMEDCKDCPSSSQLKIHSADIDAVSGKVVSPTEKSGKL